MKKNKRLVLLLLFITASLFVLNAQSKKERRAQKEKQVKELIESSSYRIDVSTAYPQRGRTIQLYSPYSIEIRNDSVFSYLPYYGRAYSIPYGGGQGLIFNAPLDTYRIETEKNNATKISFTTRTQEDRFDFRIKVFTNGTASIDVSMQQRQSISFAGGLFLPL